MQSNRGLWEEWTRIHVGGDFYDVASFRDGSDPNRLRPYEIAEIGDVRGKDLLHVQCHFGIDTLSWARLGATVTGADFSPAAIAEARKLAEEVGIDATFVESNLYDLPNNLSGDFDIVYTSRGVLGWLPDIVAWAQVVSGFVRPGGFLYVTEIHPVLQAFDDEGEPGELKLRYRYWNGDPIRIPVQGSYADPTAQWRPPPCTAGTIRSARSSLRWRPRGCTSSTSTSSPSSNGRLLFSKSARTGPGDFPASWTRSCRCSSR